ncbi:GNAT family N-acetyltransferase [Thermodesulfobacteriota bacterium]
MTETTAISIRPARPEDAPQLAKLILLAGRAHVQRGIWEVVLDRPEEECLTFLQHLSITQTPHLFHHACYLIAEDNQPIACLGGYDPKTHGYNALQQAIPEVVRKLNFPFDSSAESERRTNEVLSCIPEELEGAWVIDSVTTLPEYRARGIAGQLLEEVLAVGRTRGYSHAQINVYIGNTPAIRMYEKFGFRMHEEKRNSAFLQAIGSPGMVSMVKGLSPDSERGPT